MPHAHILISTMLMVHVELLFNNDHTNVGNLVSVVVEGSGSGPCSSTGYLSLSAKVNKMLCLPTFLSGKLTEWRFVLWLHFFVVFFCHSRTETLVNFYINTFRVICIKNGNSYFRTLNKTFSFSMFTLCQRTSQAYLPTSTFIIVKG